MPQAQEVSQYLVSYWKNDAVILSLLAWSPQTWSVAGSGWHPQTNSNLTTANQLEATGIAEVAHYTLSYPLHLNSSVMTGVVSTDLVGVARFQSLLEADSEAFHTARVDEKEGQEVEKSIDSQDASPE